MPSTNKTPNLGLNNWIATDKPKRTDFTADNLLLDQIIGEHLEDTDLHLSADDRTRLESSLETRFWSGNGSASVSVAFPFEPSAVFVCRADAPFCLFSTSTGYTVVNAAFATQSYASAGCALSGNTLTLSQTAGSAQNSMSYNLNHNGSVYTCVAFR